jgi:hypothetical protein
MEGLDSGPRLIAAARGAADHFAEVELKPAELADAATAWVAAESSAFVRGAVVPHARLRLRVPDAVLVALTLTPALALLGA